MQMTWLNMPLTPSCAVEDVFPQAEEHFKYLPSGYIDLEYGYLPSIPRLGLKSAFWAWAEDPLHVPNCRLYLVKFLDGSPVAVRYDKRSAWLVESVERINETLCRTWVSYKPGGHIVTGTVYLVR